MICCWGGHIFYQLSLVFFNTCNIMEGGSTSVSRLHKLWNLLRWIHWVDQLGVDISQFEACDKDFNLLYFVWNVACFNKMMEIVVFMSPLYDCYLLIKCNIVITCFKHHLKYETAVPAFTGCWQVIVQGKLTYNNNIYINCNWAVTWWQWLFYMYTSIWSWLLINLI
jgi:hypothetical protein